MTVRLSHGASTTRRSSRRSRSTPIRPRLTPPNRPDGINVTNLQDGAGLVWTKNGNQVSAIAYDTTGKPDPILLGANTQLTSGAFSTNVVRDIDVAMTVVLA